MTSRIRAALISKIYQDTTALRHTEIKDAAAVTLMGTDVERIIASLSQVHEIWAAVPEISIAVWLLVRRISYAAIVPLIICLSKYSFDTFGSNLSCLLLSICCLS